MAPLPPMPGMGQEAPLPQPGPAAPGGPAPMGPPVQ
jgi:hypothetical protein